MQLQQNTIVVRFETPAIIESVDEYIQRLQPIMSRFISRLSRSCNCSGVTAEEYRLNMDRDSFINGISTSVIRQRLIDYQTLTLT
ncbi:hypothetical protein GJ496_008899 [Pomphorhynchus laevis]|nr:hypothetical protein GJ496_008899 [Pomphorhynchus laevis]